MIEWREIPGDARYEVSEFGDLRTRSTGRMRKPYLATNGYLVFSIRSGGRARPVFAHRLVALAFIGAPPSAAHEVAHSDGNRQNNWRGNLRWATKRENAADRRIHGRDTIGEQHGMRTLREAQVVMVFALALVGLPIRAIAERMAIDKAQVWRILHRKNWAHIEIPPELTYKPKLHTPMAA